MREKYVVICIGMEFKVWIDGVQHVVCGVTGTTTCQDVIAAVARVTERTGSFIMLEISYRKQVFVRASDYLLKRYILSYSIFFSFLAL